MTDVQGGEVARLQAKDDQAFRSLVERLQQPITGYLYRLVGDREVALDLSQDTFLQVYKEIGKTSSDLALDAWIYRIATNYGLQYLHRKRIRPFIRFSACVSAASEEGSASWENGGSENQFFQLPSTGPSVEEQAEMRILMEQALAVLKPKDAVCLQLYYGNDFTYEQIGKIVDMTPEAVRKRIARGVEKFRAAYGKELARTPAAQQLQLPRRRK